MICPITDAFVAHHGSLGTFVRVDCYDAPAGDAIEFMRSIDGIELVLGRQEAAARFELPFDVEGDAVAISTKTHCIGMGRADHDLTDLHGARLRTHACARTAASPSGRCRSSSAARSTTATGSSPHRISS